MYQLVAESNISCEHDNSVQSYSLRCRLVPVALQETSVKRAFVDLFPTPSEYHVEFHDLFPVTGSKPVCISLSISGNVVIPSLWFTMKDAVLTKCGQVSNNFK